ncbi:MAG: hypothetical protein JWM12_92 [Ilumatobacteraceae bacterium]|nr:hypothetical protein [Ilumatobacteraceae bacterium]
MTMLAPAPADREPLLWLAPSPLWEDATVGVDQPGFERPWLVELRSDEFIPAFLALMSGEDPSGPSGIGALVPTDGSGTFATPSVLYRPLHGCFYLVVGSLVCRRIGLPDREVLPQGQRVSFVIRRVAAGGAEQAWLPASSSWVATGLVDGLVAGEEQHPMHAASVDAVAATGPSAHLLGLDDPGRRQVHYGYVPVTGRSAATPPLADPLGALATDDDAQAGDDPRVMEFRLRIAGAWSSLVAAAAITTPPGAPVDVHEPSLFLLLDLADWLGKYLPEVLDGLTGTSQVASDAPAALALQQYLDIDVDVTDTTQTPAVTTKQKLGTVLAELVSFAPLVTGQPHDLPTDLYDVSLGLPTDFFDKLNGSTAGNAGLVGAALNEDNPKVKPAKLPPELTGAIVPRSDDPAATADRFVMRLVYEHEPCDPVLSKPSAVVRFAGNYDPDAPARQIRIELPDPAHLRRFTRGVAIDMPPALRNMLDRVTPKMLKEEAPGPAGQWSIGMICSFSLQIIMLVAFIVMFIFLILLNIVFWWLPFLKICFPVPKQKSASP